MSKHSGPPKLLVVPDSFSHDTVDCLRHLLELAEAGKIVGIAASAQFNGQLYAPAVTGVCSRNPTFARGMLAALDDHLADLAHNNGG